MRLHQSAGCLQTRPELPPVQVLVLKFAALQECSTDVSLGCRKSHPCSYCNNNCLVFLAIVGDTAGLFSWWGSRKPRITMRAMGDLFSFSSRRCSRTVHYGVLDLLLFGWVELFSLFQGHLTFENFLASFPGSTGDKNTHVSAGFLESVFPSLHLKENFQRRVT